MAISDVVERLRNSISDSDTPGVDWFEGRISELQDINSQRDEAFNAYDQMENREWDLPTNLKQQWILKSTEPRFAQVLDSAKNIVAGKEPQLTITPYSPNDRVSKEVADRHEKAVRWMIDHASRRREATVMEDMAHSMFKYAEVAVQVVFLPQQEKAIKDAGGSANRIKGMRRQGDFVLDVHNPHDVYPRYSPFGLEEVALITDTTVSEIENNWGDKASELSQWVGAHNANVEDPQKKIREVKLYDYVNWDWRGVYVKVSGLSSNQFTDRSGSMIIPIHIDKWKWPFLPWVCRIAGTSLEARSDRKRRPLLYDAYTGEDWDLMNRVRTLRFSDMLRYAASPKRWFQSSRRMQPQIDQYSPDFAVHLYEDENTGSYDPPPPDPNMGTLYAELAADHERSTLSSILQGGEIPSQTAFATINLVTHSALGAVRPFTFALENAYNDMVETMLLWIHYSNHDVLAYDINDEEEAAEYEIKASEIKPDRLYINTKLEPEIPTDDQAKASMLGMLRDRGALTRRAMMEEMGIENATAAEEELYLEQMMDTILATELQNIQLTGSQQARAQIEQEIMQTKVMPLLQQLQEQMGAGQQQGQPVPEQAMVPRPGPQQDLPAEERPPTGIPSEANPNEGGPVPATINPGATRERQTGRDRGGTDLA